MYFAGRYNGDVFMEEKAENIKILFVENISTDVELACRSIKKEHIPFLHKVVDTEEAFKQELDAFYPDVIVSDYMMPYFDGMRALKIARAFSDNIPFIVLTGSMNEETAVACMKAGASDYVLKEKITRLPFAIKEAIEKNKALKEKMQMEKQVLDSLHEYQDLINSMNETVWIIDFDGTLLDVNNRAEVVLKYSKKELLDIGVCGVDKNFSKDEVKDLIKTLRHDKIHVFQTVHKTKEGKDIPVEISSSLIRYRGNQAVLSVARDISDRIKAERKLRLLSRAVEQNPVAIEITDQNGNIEYVNPVFSSITGYKAKEAIGNNPKILNSGYHSKQYFKNLWDTILSGQEWTGVLKNKKKNGELYWEEAVISPIVNEQGNITHFVAVKEDITEKKKMHEDLVAAKEKAEESDRLKSSFLANMSHEIRTPMNGILGFTDLLKDPNLSEEQIKTYVEIIQRSGRRMLNTVNDIIEVSKIETGQIDVNYHNVNVYKEISGLVDFFQPECKNKGLKLILENEAPDKPPVIVTDENKLISIITNLIKNAIKYTDKGHIKIGYDIKDGYLSCYVKDTGIGIPEEKQAFIFDRFTRLEVVDKKALQGSGLGLSITKSYVEILGGNISVKSEPEKGSVFSFFVPLNSKGNMLSKRKSDAKPEIYKADTTKLKTLIVEDDPVAEMYLSVVMQELSEEILFAGNGKEAIDIYKKHPDVDIILMDVKMPEADGYTATKKIRKINDDVVIIAQTAYVAHEEKEKAIKAGCDAYIPKPIKRNKLLSVIDELMQAK
ncbi:MAG: PAS domain S-box protein [Bacteroidales bacterium]